MAGLISVDEARRLIATAITPLAKEIVPLRQAAGRVLAEDVHAALDQPPFSASAMDGYAVRFADLRAGSTVLRVIGESAAGARFSGAVRDGEAVRIFTGAPMPEGADHVVIQEETDRTGDILTVKAEQRHAANVRAAGIDFRCGEKIGAAGRRLSGRTLALIAAGNIDRVTVYRQPRIGILANGDELRLPAVTLGADEIVSSIPFGLAPMIEEWGGVAVDLGIARDDPDDIAARIDTARNVDLIVPVGGASVGDRDFMRAAFRKRGFESVFEKVAIRPGKPTWFGRNNNGPFVLGLPGNPASALVTARIFLKTAIAHFVGGEDGEQYRRYRLATPLAPNGARETYLRARLIEADDGEQRVEAFMDQDSSLLSVIAASDLFVRRMAGAPATETGDPVTCMHW